MAMGTKKKATAKRPAKKGPARKAAKKAAPLAKAKSKAVAAKAPARRLTPAEEVANRIVAAMDDAKSVDLGKFYTEDAVSVEPAGGTTTGLQALRSKLASWLAGLRSASYKARNVFVSKNVICIEWECALVMKDGRQVTLNEIAVHELRGEKICKERFYYDPLALRPPAKAMPIPPAKAMPIPPSKAMPIPPGKAMPVPPGKAMPIPPAKPVFMPPAKAMQPERPRPPAPKPAKMDDDDDDDDDSSIDPMDL